MTDWIVFIYILGWAVSFAALGVERKSLWMVILLAFVWPVTVCMSWRRESKE